MKRMRYSILPIVLSLIILSVGCSLQKRHYRKGFYVYSKRKPVENVARTEKKSEIKEAGSPDVLVVNGSAAELPRNIVGLTCDAREFPRIPVVFQRAVDQLHAPSKFEKKSDNIVATNHSKEPQKRKLEWMGITALLFSIAGWIALFTITIGWLQVGLFAAGAILAALSMTKMSRNPEGYAMKTGSFVALLLALIGLAIILYAVIIYLLS